MDPGRSRGDQRGRGTARDAGGYTGGGARGYWPGENPGDDARRPTRPARPSTRQSRLRPDTGQLPAVDQEAQDSAAQHLHAPASQPATDPAQYDISDFQDRLFSGPVAELYGVAGGSVSDDNSPPGFAAFGDDPDAGRSLGDTGGSVPLPPAPRREGESPADAGPETSSGLVRPYFRTRGRTKPSYDLALEALVSTSERGRMLDGVRVPEHRSICDLCLDTRSVAEVAALLSLPLGVVRVLVGDVAGLGLVLVHSASSGVGDRPSVEFMERVLSGLRRI